MKVAGCVNFGIRVDVTPPKASRTAAPIPNNANVRITRRGAHFMVGTVGADVYRVTTILARRRIFTLNGPLDLVQLM